MSEPASIDGLLPMAAPLPCPICGNKVLITAVTEWESESGKIVSYEYECETEPDIDSDEWWGHHGEHYSMPYVDWLPWEKRVDRWLARRYIVSEQV